MTEPRPESQGPRLSPRAVKWCAIMVIGAAFVVGMAAGVLLRDASYRMGHPAGFAMPMPMGGDFTMPAPVPAPFGVDLFDADLSEEQRRRIEEIFAKHRARLDRVMQESLPRVRAVTDEIDREIRALLTPEQREKLDRGSAVRLPAPPGPGGGLLVPAPRGDGLPPTPGPAR